MNCPKFLTFSSQENFQTKQLATVGSFPEPRASAARGIRIVEWSPLQSVFSTDHAPSNSPFFSLTRAAIESGAAPVVKLDLEKIDTSILNFSLIHRLQSMNCIAFSAVYFYLRHWLLVQLSQLHVPIFLLENSKIHLLKPTGWEIYWSNLFRVLICSSTYVCSRRLDGFIVPKQLKFPHWVEV